MEPLQGPRVRVRPFRPEDAAALRAYRDDEATARYQGWDLPYTDDDATAFVAWAGDSTLGVPGSWSQLAVERRDEPGLVGDIGVHTLMDEPNVVELGVTLAPHARGKGYADEAIQLVLDHLVGGHGIATARALMVTANTSSVRLFERLGFERIDTRVADDGEEEHLYERRLSPAT